MRTLKQKKKKNVCHHYKNAIIYDALSILTRCAIHIELKLSIINFNDNKENF